MKDDIKDTFSGVPEETYKPETEKKKSVKNKLIDVMNFFNDKYSFRYNTFTAKVEFKNCVNEDFVPFDERALHDIITKVKVDGGININRDDLKALIGSSKLSGDYDPVKEYLFSLPQWDGVDRIPEFLKQIQLADESMRLLLVKYFTRWFVAMIGSLIDKNVYNENCLVFCGPQGKGKTRFFRALLPVHLRQGYIYDGNFNPKDKDHLEYLGTKILILLDEMATLNRVDIESLKTTMSLQSITLRRAYGHANVHLWRRASFCGSHNVAQFMTDLTGNRRWLPFAIHNIDVIEIYHDLDKIYAQGLALFKEGYRTWFDRLEIMELEKYNEAFRHITMEEELILENYSIPTDDEIKSNSSWIEYKTTTAIINGLASLDENKKINVNDTVLKRTGQALTKLGFKQFRKRISENGNALRVWAVKRLGNIEREGLTRPDHYKEDNII